MSFYEFTDFICRFFLSFQEFSGNSAIRFHHFVFRRESAKLAFGTIRIVTFVCRITTDNTFIGSTIGTTSFCSHFGIGIVCDYIISIYFYGFCEVDSAVIFTGAVVGGDGVEGVVSVLPNGFSFDARVADSLYKNPAN